MSQKNLFTIQPFFQWKPKLKDQDDTSDRLPVSSAPRRRCCSPCKGQKVITVRPVLCSTVLSESNSNKHSSSTDCFSVGNYYKTPAGGAWIEHNSQPADEQVENWERAKRYNEEVENCSLEKASKLKEFQKEVKLRVKHIEKEKHRLLLARTQRDLELERNVARRTAFLAQASIPYASEVMVRGRTDRIVKTFSSADTENKNPSEEALAKIAKSSRSIEVERSMKKRARQRLVSKQLTNVVGKELPGGCWRDTSFVEFHDYEDEVPALGDKDGNTEIDNLQECEAIVAGDLDTLKIAEDDSPTREEIVIERVADKPIGRSLAYSVSGQEEEEMRKQKIKQRSLLRRLYMDIERERVKEYKKMKSHLDSIAEIKRVKEEERTRQELKAVRDCLAASGPPPETADYANQVLEKERMLRKQKENNRYIKALRSLLKEKIDRLGIDMPPLCSCGSSIWDAHPDLCANNCPFYKNPKGYERAVQSLIASCDVD